MKSEKTIILVERKGTGNKLVASALFWGRGENNQFL